MADGLVTFQDDPAQMAAGAMITFFFLLLNMTRQPLCSDSLNSLQSFSMVAQFLTLFVGLMLALNSSKDQEPEAGASSADRAVVSILILLVNCTTMVFPLVRLILNGGLRDYYEQTLTVLGTMYAWLCCSLCSKDRIHQRKNKESIRSRFSISKGHEEDSSSEDDDSNNAFSGNHHHVSGLNWWVNAHQCKKTANQKMPPIVQKARAFTGWRQMATSFDSSDFRAPLALGGNIEAASERATRHDAADQYSYGNRTSEASAHDVSLLIGIDARQHVNGSAHRSCSGGIQAIEVHPPIQTLATLVTQHSSTNSTAVLGASSSHIPASSYLPVCCLDTKLSPPLLLPPPLTPFGFWTRDKTHARINIYILPPSLPPSRTSALSPPHPSLSPSLNACGYTRSLTRSLTATTCRGCE